MEQHACHFKERNDGFMGARLFVAVCSCGWTGCAAASKALTKKLWKRHFERITGRKAA